MIHDGMSSATKTMKGNKNQEVQGLECPMVGETLGWTLRGLMPWRKGWGPRLKSHPEHKLTCELGRTTCCLWASMTSSIDGQLGGHSGLTLT